MKRVSPFVLTAILSFFSSFAFATIYTFTGNGSWSTASNWAGNKMPPPFNMPTDSIIVTGSCSYPGSTEYICQGYIRIANGGTFTIESPHVNMGIGAFEARGKMVIEGTVTIQSDMTNYGYVDIYGMLNNNGIFSCPVGVITIRSSGTFNNTGTTGAAFTVENGGIFNNTGTLNGTANYSGIINNSGTLAPGNSPGTIQIDGSYVATSIATHNFEIAGTSTSQYDRLLVNGSVTLNGTLNVSLINGFTPSGTHDLVIFTGAINGTFSTVNLPSGYTLIYNLNDVTLQFGGTLPVVFESFKASFINNKAVLNWKTSYEQNNFGFDVEYSVDGRNWRKIGFVQAKEDNFTGLYSFEFAGITEGINYFRLKQLDKDGKSKYSEVVFLIAKKNEILFYPNPVQEFVQFKTPQTGTVQIFDASGKLIFKKNIVAQQILNLPKVSSGTYLMRLVLLNGSIENQKCVISN
jgi:hypothetical protein